MMSACDGLFVLPVVRQGGDRGDCGGPGYGEPVGAGAAACAAA